MFFTSTKQATLPDISSFILVFFSNVAAKPWLDFYFSTTALCITFFFNGAQEYHKWKVDVDKLINSIFGQLRIKTCQGISGWLSERARQKQMILIEISVVKCEGVTKKKTKLMRCFLSISEESQNLERNSGIASRQTCVVNSNEQKQEKKALKRADRKQLLPSLMIAQWSVLRWDSCEFWKTF